MKKYISIMLLATSVVSFSQITKSDSIKIEPANKYCNGVGLKLLKGISYKHYFKYISSEFNLGFGFGGFYRAIINPQLIICYQKNTKHAIQPYAGIAIDLTYLTGGNSAGFRDTTLQAQAYVYPSVVAGIEWFVKKTRLSFCLDALLGYRNSTTIPLEINVGFKIRFTKK
ncbi:MAG: hypothetical protein EAZ53_13430 [Bacteroidetes bacterium]|nr:MAG: hypothetical protein EAZ53_13430 [Bacteroidota bacterium]